MTRAHGRSGLLLAVALLCATAARAQSPEPTPTPEPKPRLELYGFTMLDMGFQTKQNHPDWFDTMRPTRLPAFPNEFGEDGRFYASVRQTRFGVRGFIPTELGEIKTLFEFNLFGAGADAGQTTFRLRHAWGELGHFGAGQTWSPFMDPDMFPKSVEFNGPGGIAWIRNVQLRYMPLMGDTSVAIALERPGASGDDGVYADRVELRNIKGRFPLPDLSANVRRRGAWGHVQLAGILRRIQWDDVLDDAFDLSGETTGWGLNASTNIKIDKDVLRASVVYGKGMENTMNDAPVDIGIRNNLFDPVTPLLGRPLPVLGLTAFYDRTWNAKWTTTLGYSLVDIDNSDGQADDAFHRGHYALANLLYYPVPSLFFGPEVQWGKRENFRDGFTSDDLKFQFSVKYSFKGEVGGK